MKRVVTVAMIAPMFALAACATQPQSYSSDAPGFLWGLVHGFLCLFSLIGSFFGDVRVYAFPNTGRWYDAGFVLGAACFFGAIGHSFEETYVLGYADGEAGARARNKKSN